MKIANFRRVSYSPAGWPSRFRLVSVADAQDKAGPARVGQTHVDSAAAGRLIRKLVMTTNQASRVSQMFLAGVS